jgi:hypothetical protein
MVTLLHSTFLSTLLVSLSLTFVTPIHASGCAFVFETGTGTVKLAQSPLHGVTSTFLFNADGMYTYDTSTSVHRQLEPHNPSALEKFTRPSRLTGLDNSAGRQIPIQHMCGTDSDDNQKLVYARSGKVVLFICRYEKDRIGWEDVREYMKFLNAECVYGYPQGYPGILGMF